MVDMTFKSLEEIRMQTVVESIILGALKMTDLDLFVYVSLIIFASFELTLAIIGHILIAIEDKEDRHV